MTNEQISEIIRLNDQKMSYRDIEAQTGISKSTIARVVNEYKAQSTPDEEPETDPPAKAPTPIAAPPQKGKTADEVELGKLDLTLSHQRSMKELSLKEEELALDRKRVEIEAAKVENDKQVINFKERQIANDKKEKEDRELQQQELIVKKFNRLLKDLLKNCTDATWAEEEVDEFVKKIKDILTKVGRICDAKAIDEETLAIFRSAQKLIELVEKTQEEHTHTFGSDVDFDFDKEKIAEIKSWEVEHFSDEVDEDEEDDDDDEGENDERETELLEAFNDLVDVLLDNSDNSSWSEKEYDEYETSITDFEKELTEYTEDFEDEFDEDEQAITVNLKKLAEFVSDREAVVEDEDDTLTVNTKPKQKQMLKALQLDDFWQEA